MRSNLVYCLVLVAATAALVAPARATVLVSTDFNSTELSASVANGAPIGGGITTRVGIIAGQEGATISVVDQGGGDHAVRFTDNVPTATTNNVPTLYKGFSGLSTTDTGDNHITGSFAFTRLSVSSGTEGSFQYAMVLSGIVSGGTNTIIALRMNGNQLLYSNGTNRENVLSTDDFAVAQDVEYIISFDVDLSSDTQDTWSYSIAAASAPTVALYASPTLETYLDNATPGSMIWRAGLDNAAASPDPFAQVDDINFEAFNIPEPASMALLGLGGLLITVRRRHRVS